MHNYFVLFVFFAFIFAAFHQLLGKKDLAWLNHSLYCFLLFLLFKWKESVLCFANITPLLKILKPRRDRVHIHALVSV